MFRSTFKWINRSTFIAVYLEDSADVINTTAEYALRATVYLASNIAPDADPSDFPLIGRDEIAEQTRIPIDYLVKVMKSLDMQGIVRSQRGPGGGYRLLNQPEEISALEVIEAVSEVPRIHKCPLEIRDHIKLCPLHARLDAVAAEAEKAFRETSVAELVPSRKIRSGCAFPTKKK